MNTFPTDFDWLSADQKSVEPAPQGAAILRQQEASVEAGFLDRLLKEFPDPLAVEAGDVTACSSRDGNNSDVDGATESQTSTIPILGAQPDQEDEQPLDPWDRANLIILGLSEVLNHHKVPSEVLVSFKKQAFAYLVHSDEAVYMKRLKYLTQTPMALLSRNELPPTPDIGIVWSGRYLRWQRSRLSFCAKNLHLWWSFYQGKRAAAPVSAEYVLSEMKSHRARMASPDPITYPVLDGIMEQLEELLMPFNRHIIGRLSNPDQARETRTDDFNEALVRAMENQLPNGRASDHLTVASQSACYESTRSQGGQAGYLERVARTDGDLYPVLRCHGLRTDYELRSVEYRERVVLDDRYLTKEVFCMYGYPGASWMSKVFRDSYCWAGRVLKCEIRGIIEPLKVRVISKGPAAPYYMSKPLQEVMHSYMREIPCFRLIGETITPSCIDDIRDNYVRVGSGPLQWMSIDYSAATDGLSAALSRRILERLTRGAYPIDRERWMSVLAPHLCVYPEEYNLDPIEQINGQLMGSILSFPILCLANLGLYLYLIREDTRSLAEKMSGVLVNGDDMLYAAPSGLFREHVALGDIVGLKMSIGKAYHHSKFASVNSHIFVCDLTKNDRVIGVPFFNVGLLMGNNKVMRVASSKDGDASQASKLSLIAHLLEGCYRRDREFGVLTQYLYRHHDLVVEEAGGRNFFLDESFGGCGVPRPEGWKFEITLRQHQVAVSRLEQATAQFSYSFDQKCIGPTRWSAPTDEMFCSPVAPWGRRNVSLEHTPSKQYHDELARRRSLPYHIRKSLKTLVPRTYRMKPNRFVNWFEHVCDELLGVTPIIKSRRNFGLLPHGGRLTDQILESGFVVLRD